MEAMEVGFSYAAFEANVGPFCFSFSEVGDDASIARHCVEEPAEGRDWTTAKLVVD